MAPKPGLTDPAFALKRSCQRKGLLFCLAVLLFSSLGLFANTVREAPGVPDVNHPDTKLSVVMDYAFAGHGLNKIKAHIVDEFGDPVVGVDVSFTWNPGTGDVSVGSTTDANGDAFLSTGFITAGTLDIKAKVLIGSVWVPLISANPITVTYIEYKPDVNASETTLSVTSNNAKANGSATNCVKAHIAGANGLPVDGQTVDFVITGAATAASPLSAVTDINGDATLCMTSTVAGNVTVTATVNGVPIVNGSPASVTFVADVPSTSNPATKFTVEKNNAVANGTDNNQVKAHIVDANGNPVPNQDVVIEIVSGTASPSTIQTVMTNAAGDAVLDYTSTVAGNVVVKASVGGTALSGSPKTITFVNDVPSVSAPTTFLEITSNNAKANGTATNCVKAHITDANGNPVAGQTVVFTITGSASPSTAVSVTTNAQGEASSCYTSLVAGSVVVTAKLGANTINAPKTLLFIADVPSTSNPATKFTVEKNNAVANGTDNNQVKAHVVDANGNPVPNQDVVIEIVSGTASPSTIQTIKTDANGDAVLNYTSTVAGNVVVKASVGGTALSGSPKTITFVNDVPSVSAPTTFLEITSNNAKANGTATNCVKAHVTDAHGNPVAGQTVVFTITGSANPSTAVSVTTNAQGEASSCYTSLVAGSVVVTAKLGANTINTPKTLLFIADVPSTSNPATKFTVEKNNAVANGTDNNQVKAHIVDANGNPVPNQDVVIEIVSGTASPSTIQTVKTDANGDAVLNYTSTVAGNVVVKASVGGTALSGSPKTITFVNDAPSTGSPTTFLEITSNNAKANGTATNCVKAHVTDAHGNPVAGQTVVFTIIGSASPSTAVSVTTNAQGEASSCYTSTVAGSIVVTAKLGGNIINGAQTLTFIADAPSTGSPDTKFEVTKNNAAANGTDNNQVTAHITDANGNPVPNQDVVIEIVSGTASPSTIQTVKTDANGDAVLNYTSTVAGNVVVKASLGGVALSGSPQTITFVADAPNTGVAGTYIIAVKALANADGSDANIVEAHVVDAQGNPVKNQEVIFTLAGGTTTSGTQSVTTNNSGIATLYIVSTEAGWIEITATVNGAEIVNGKPCKVRFVEGAPDTGNDKTRLEVVTDNAPADDITTNSVKAHIADAYDNPVPNQTVVFTIASGDATPGTYTAVTDANGDAVFELHSGKGGEVTVTATLGTTGPVNNGSPAKVRFIADPDVTNPLTVLTVLTDNALANGVATNSVKVHISDAYGNPLANKEIEFAISAGNAVFTVPGPYITDANGDVIALLTSPKVGNVGVTARIGGSLINGSPATVRFTMEDIWVPKVFTPNGDGTNDVLKPFVSASFELTYFSIYNRWGNLVFTTTNASGGWDGRLKGVMQPVETYLWVIGGKDKDGNPVVKRGMTSLVR